MSTLADVQPVISIDHNNTFDVVSDRPFLTGKSSEDFCFSTDEYFCLMKVLTLAAFFFASFIFSSMVRIIQLS